MRNVIFIAVSTLALAACGGRESETNNAMTDSNMMMSDPNMMMTDPNMMMTDPNMMGANGMDANMAMDPATQNAMMQDMNTNDPDTNLANGM